MEHFSSGSDAIMVYPNPFEEELVLKGTKQDGIITVYDLSGKLTGQYPASEDQTLIQTVVIKPGFYMLNYTDKKNSINYKVTKF